VAHGADDAARTTLETGAVERAGGLASLVDEAAGLTREVVEARLALVEWEVPGPRLPKDVAVLERQRPSPDAPPPGAEGNPRWGEYVAYYEKRVRELRQGKANQGPLRWTHYEQMWGWFTRGLAFERFMVALLEADAALPRAQSRFLGAFLQPRILRSVGVWKPESGLRYADGLVIEEGGPAGAPPRIETFSFKSRDFSGLEEKALKALMLEDAREALQKYGGTLNIRRPSLQSLLLGSDDVPVQRVRLVYDKGNPMPRNARILQESVEETESRVPGVEVLFQ
jgi:hypothetical protein